MTQVQATPSSTPTVTAQIIDRGASSVSNTIANSTVTPPAGRVPGTIQPNIRSNSNDCCCLRALICVSDCMTSPFTTCSKNSENSPAGDGVTFTGGSCLDRVFGLGSQTSYGDEGIHSRSAGWCCTTDVAVTNSDGNGLDVSGNVDLHGPQAGDIGEGDRCTQAIQGSAECIGEAIVTAAGAIGDAAECVGEAIGGCLTGTLEIVGALAGN